MYRQEPQPLHSCSSIPGCAKPPACRRKVIARRSHSSPQLRQRTPLPARQLSPIWALMAQGESSLSKGRTLPPVMSGRSRHTCRQTPQKLQPPLLKSIRGYSKRSRTRIPSGQASTQRPHREQALTNSSAATDQGGRISTRPPRSRFRLLISIMDNPAVTKNASRSSSIREMT